MQWHQERQRLLAENVANADTPNLPGRSDLAPLISIAVTLSAASTVARAHQSRHHIAVDRRPVRHSPATAPAPTRSGRRGNAVSHEDEMIKVAANQMDYQAATDALHAQSRPDQARGQRATLDAAAERIDRWSATWPHDGFPEIAAIAASGLRAQAGRMRIISENIANVDSTATTPGGDPYRRRIVTLHKRARPLARRRRRQARAASRPILPTSGPARARQSGRRRATATSNIPTSIRWSK